MSHNIAVVDMKHHGPVLARCSKKHEASLCNRCSKDYVWLRLSRIAGSSRPEKGQRPHHKRLRGSQKQPGTPPLAISSVLSPQTGALKHTRARVLGPEKPHSSKLHLFPTSTVDLRMTTRDERETRRRTHKKEKAKSNLSTVGFVARLLYPIGYSWPSACCSCFFIIRAVALPGLDLCGERGTGNVTTLSIPTPTTSAIRAITARSKFSDNIEPSQPEVRQQRNQRIHLASGSNGDPWLIIFARFHRTFEINSAHPARVRCINLRGRDFYPDMPALRSVYAS